MVKALRQQEPDEHAANVADDDAKDECREVQADKFGIKE